MQDDPIAEFKDWFVHRPIVTKAYITIATLIALSLSLNLIIFNDVYYTFDQMWSNFEIWRPFSATLVLGDFGPRFLLKLYMVYHAFLYAQRDAFQKKQLADFLMLLTYVFWVVVLFSSLYDIYFLVDPVVFALIYVWSKKKPFQTIRLVFGISMQSGYYPWVYLGFNVLMGYSLIAHLFGFIAGYTYFSIKTTLYEKYHKDYLPTPGIYKSLTALYLKRQNNQHGEYAQQRQRGNEQREQMYQQDQNYS